MSHHRPIGAAVCTLIGGFFITVVGFWLALLGTAFAFFLHGFAAFFFIGLAVGLLTIVMGVLMLVAPGAKTAWGIVTILLAIVSLPTALGGFLLGFILALIGGILALTYKSEEMPARPYAMPPPVAPGGVPPPPGTCRYCGASNMPGAIKCAACGASLA